MKRLHTIKKLPVRLLVVAALFVAAVAIPLTATKPQQAQAAVASDASSTTPCVGSSAPSTWKHVVLIMFENQSYSNVIGSADAPYISSLASKCATSKNWKDSNYKVDGTSDGSYVSKPSYATLTNGLSPSVHGLKDDTYSTKTSADNIYNQLRLKGKNGKNYFSWSGTGCSATGSGDYHDAIRYYSNIDSTYCNSHDLNISQFMTDVNNGNLPEFSMVLPTNCQNMHSCSSVSNVVQNGDNWIKNFLPQLLDSQQYKSGDTAIFYVWDEDSPIPNVMISPSVAPGSSFETNGKLSADVTATATTLQLSSSLIRIGFPTSGQFNVKVGSEEMTVTGGQNSDTWTVTRGVNGTAAATHKANDPVYSVTNINPISHFAALRTWEEMLGLPLIGDTAKAPSLLSVFNGCATTCTPSAGDTTPPTVAVTSPTNGATVIGSPITVSANVSDNVGVKQVEFFVNGTSKSVDTTSPYSFSWDTTGLSGGSYTIKAIATDTASPANTSETSITVSIVTSPTCSVTLPSTSYGSATMSLNVPADGVYHAWSRLMAPDTTNNSYILQIDNDCPILIGNAVLAANSWTWVDYQNGNSASKTDVTLKAGAHSVKLIGNEPNVGLDRVMFLSDTCVPTATGDNCLTPPPAPPTATLTYPPSGQVLHDTETLTANATASSGASITNVEFFQGLTSLGKDTSSPYSASWNTTGVGNGTYTISAIATDSLGQKSAASSSTVTVQNLDTSNPSQPGNFRTTSVTTTKVSLAWDASTDNKGVAGYNVYLNGSASPYATVTGTTFDDTNATPNTSYTYQVEAFDAAGNKSTKASLGVTTLPEVDNPPTTPSSLTAKANADYSADLSWTASTDDKGIKEYSIRRNGIVVGTTTDTTYHNTGLLPSTTYQYAVIAQDTIGQSSGASNTASITTPAAQDTEKPSVPGGVTAVAPSAYQVNVAWSASTDNVGVAGYKVFRNGSLVATITTTSFGDATVSPGQTYSYTVSAVDGSNNESAQSSAASVTVPNADSTTILSDNFEGGSALWTPVKGSWSVAGDGAQGNVYRQGASGDAWSTAGVSTMKDYAVEANIKPTQFITDASPSQFAAVYGRWQDGSHWYYVVLRSSGVIELKKNVGNVYTVLASKQTTVTPGTWYTVKLSMLGSDLRVSLNGQEVLSANDSSITQGQIGLGTYNAYANFDDVKVTQNTAPVLTVLTPEADSFVLKGYPNRNYGTRPNVGADANNGNPIESGLIRFNVSGVNGRTVTKATLVLNVTDSSYVGGQFYSVSNAWTETGVTWNNAPAIPSGAQPIATLGTVKNGTQIQVDVTNLIRGDGTYTIRINTNNKDIVKYGSRESSKGSSLWVSSQFLGL